MYKRGSLLLLFVLLIINSTRAQVADPNMGIIPAPVSVQKAPGEFLLSQQTIIMADSVNDQAVQFLVNYLQDKYMLRNPVKPNTGNNSANTLILTAAGTEDLAPEGYRLSINPQQITIAGKGAGLFYGIQTLIQLLPLEKTGTARLPCAQIEDYPRFSYRGLHLDVSRHFFSVEFVKRYIDLMAAYKLNNFHWHLTDDQGWRIEIKKYPKLTQIGSQRAQTLIGNYRDHTPFEFDNTPYGGYYTQDQIREVVKYATDRYINIIPEIDMPGHSEAAVAAYPELSCDPSRTYTVGQKWGGFNDIYCPTEFTFSFLQDVLTEVMDLFPGKYIHIGGDEVSKDAWRRSDFCQKLIKRLRLKGLNGLQSYFIQRIEKFVNARGRSIIGWDEILQGGLAPNATVMSWRGEAGGVLAARQKHNVILSPSNNGLYFDFSQGNINQEPLSIGGNVPYQKTYAYNPMPAALTPEQQKYILGVQANMWTEYIATEEKAEYMLLPRLMALSEVAWTPLANKDVNDFSEARLPRHLAWLDKNGFNYRVSKAIGAPDTISIATQLNVNLRSPVEGAKIYYTIDGYPPSETTNLYEHPFTLDIPEGESRELQTIVITPAGHRSLISHAIFSHIPPLAPVNFQGTETGINYKIVSGKFTDASQLDNAPVVDSGRVQSFNTTNFKKSYKNYGVIFSGYIRIDTDGKYLFSTRHNDGVNILIDNQPVVVNDTKHDFYHDGGEVILQKGYHQFTLKYFDTANSANMLHIYMVIPGKPVGELSADSIYN